MKEQMTGEELDRRMREILLAVTAENMFTSAAKMHELGFGARQSWEICEQTLKARQAGKLP